jgi:hypothetical protein
MKKIYGIVVLLIMFMTVAGVQTGYSKAKMVEQDVGYTFTADNHSILAIFTDYSYDNPTPVYTDVLYQEGITRQIDVNPVLEKSDRQRWNNIVDCQRLSYDQYPEGLFRLDIGEIMYHK